MDYGGRGLKETFHYQWTHPRSPLEANDHDGESMVSIGFNLDRLNEETPANMQEFEW